MEGRYRRFGALPLNYYSVVDPLVVPAGDSMTGDLADDLADIWRDLKSGCLVQERGDLDQAIAEWRWSYCTHRGAHAAAAQFVLQSWMSRDNRWALP